MKLVDQIVPQDKLIKAAKDWIKGGGKASRRGTRRASSCPAVRCSPRAA
jgi:hypothetical protein